MKSNRKIIKNIFRALLLLIFIYLGSQLVIYSFFEESKLVRIDRKSMDHSENTVEKKWKGNYLIIKQYSGFGCETKKYVRYNKNRIELLIIEPFILCWGTSYGQMDYTIYYNNIISSLKAYFSEDILLYEKWCRVRQSNCVVNSEVMENYDQLKDFGFVKFEKGDYNLDNLNYTYLSDEKKNFKGEFREIEEIEDAEEKMEEKYTAPINTGIRLAPTPERGTSSQGGELRSHYIYSEMMDIATGQKWNKDTKLKYCIRYKSNTDSSNYRGAVLYANSSLENKYIFQIDIYEYQTDYYCSQSAWAKGIWDKNEGRGTYRIGIPFKAPLSNEDVFHEICVDDINSQLNHCASKWGISEDDAYVTNIYQISASSQANNLSDYTILDYFRILVDGDQVSESLFPNQDFSRFSGLTDDDNSDDFVGWTEHSSVYAVDIKE